MYFNDLTQLNDKELMDRIEKVRKKLELVRAIGSSSVQTLDTMYNQLIQELDSRYDDGYKPKDIDFSMEAEE